MIIGVVYVCMLEEALTLDDFNWLLLRHARLVHVFVRVVCVCCMVHGDFSVCMMRTRYCWLLFATCCVLARTACGVFVFVPWSMVLSLVVVSCILLAALVVESLVLTAVAADERWWWWCG